MPDEVTSGRRWGADKVAPKAVASVVGELLDNVIKEGTPDEVFLSATANRESGRWDIDVNAIATTRTEDSDAA